MKNKIKHTISKSKMQFIETNTKKEIIIDTKNKKTIVHRQGYINVIINPNIKTKESSIIIANKKVTNSISIFVAGGKCIDEKIAQVNANIKEKLNK